MTNKPRWAKLQTTDIQRIQGISKTQTQNIRTVSLSCWWPCFWIWIMQSYWIYSEFLMTGETLYYLTTSVTDRWDPLLSYHLSTLTGETLYYHTTSVTDRWDPLPSYYLSTLTCDCLLSYYLSDWLVTVYYPTTSVSWAQSVLWQICMCQPVHW